MTYESFDLIIHDGWIVDGTGAAGYYGDVGIREGRIEEIGNLSECTAERRIDATGQIVAPGHVNRHSHYDAAIFWDPYCSNSGENGITTLINANCGFGFAPVRKADIDRTIAMMETTEQIPAAHQRSAMPWNWESFPDWLELMRSLPKGVNLTTFLPLNPLLIYVMGIDAAKTRSPSKEEMVEIYRLINEAMDAGAIGISMSAMGAGGNSHVDFDGTTMPTDTMDPEALIEIGRAVVERGEGVIQMLTQISHFGDRTISERMAELAKGSGVRVIHEAFMTSDFLGEQIQENIDWLDNQRVLGRDMTANSVLNRGWIEAGVRELDAASGQLQGVRRMVACSNDDELRSLLQNSEFVAEFSTEYEEAVLGFSAQNLGELVVIYAGTVEDLQPFVGKSLAQIAVELSASVVEVLVDLALRSDLELQVKSAPISTSNPALAAAILANPGVIAGASDGGAHTKSLSWGHYPTDFLIWLVRENGTMSLEDMHFQLSYKTAQSVGIRDRGALLPGFAADVLIYDLDELYFDLTRYEVVHDMPGGDWRRKAKAGGYRNIIVNGEVTHERDKSTGVTPGVVIQTTSPRSSGVESQH